MPNVFTLSLPNENRDPWRECAVYAGFTEGEKTSFRFDIVSRWTIETRLQIAEPCHQRAPIMGSEPDYRRDPLEPREPRLISEPKRDIEPWKTR